MLTDEQIAAIRARHEQMQSGMRAGERTTFDAACRLVYADMPALLAEVERLRAENAALREMVDDVRAILAFSVEEASAAQIGRASHDALTRLARSDGDGATGAAEAEGEEGSAEG